jgi:hypothetical protein
MRSRDLFDRPFAVATADLLEIELQPQSVKSLFITLSSHAVSVIYAYRSLLPSGKTLNITIEVSAITDTRLSPVLEYYIKFPLNFFQGTQCLAHRQWKTKGNRKYFGKLVTSQPASMVSLPSIINLHMLKTMTVILNEGQIYFTGRCKTVVKSILNKVFCEKNRVSSFVPSLPSLGHIRLLRLARTISTNQHCKYRARNLVIRKQTEAKPLRLFLRPPEIS